jgi:hypothetical protein
MFQNPRAKVWQLNHGECPELDKNEQGLILFPQSLQPDFHPEPVARDCWKPDPDSFYYPCEGDIDVTEIPPGESWSILHEVWIEEQEGCIPSGTYTFEGFAEAKGDNPDYPENRIGEYSLIIEPANSTTTA